MSNTSTIFKTTQLSLQTIHLDVMQIWHLDGTIYTYCSMAASRTGSERIGTTINNLLQTFNVNFHIKIPDNQLHAFSIHISSNYLILKTCTVCLELVSTFISQ